MWLQQGQSLVSDWGGCHVILRLEWESPQHWGSFTTSYWMMPLWWLLGQAPIWLQEMASSDYFFAVAGSLNSSPPQRLLGDFPESGFCPLPSCPLHHSPSQCPPPPWSLRFPFPPTLSPLTKSLLFPLPREIGCSPMNRPCSLVSLGLWIVV